jgi:catechol 2,3-dioxygenase-like lactoylglutathione lyase family enzyme
MIEHVSLPVTDLDEAKEFYQVTLAPLGYKLNMDFSPEAAGFVEGGHTSFWIAHKETVVPTHIAFRAKDKDEVHAFYDAALKAGAIDNGAPGPRPDYGPDYYAAFIIDPDGNNIEAVCYATD